MKKLLNKMKLKIQNEQINLITKLEKSKEKIFI